MGLDEGTATDVSRAHKPRVDNPSELRGWRIDELDYPTFRITLLAKVMDRLTIRALSEDTGLSYAEWRVLMRLAALPIGTTVREIAQLAWVDRAEVSRAIQSLEAKGLADRRENPLDRRMPILYLTKSGMRVYRSVLNSRRDFHEFLMSDLSSEERRTLDDLLAKIGTKLEYLTSKD